MTLVQFLFQLFGKKVTEEKELSFASKNRQSNVHDTQPTLKLDGNRRVQQVLFVIFVICFCVLCVSGYFFFFYVDQTNEVVSVLIPQPFTENNDFTYFHLPNQMKVLLVRPNSGLNNTYIG